MCELKSACLCVSINASNKLFLWWFINRQNDWTKWSNQIKYVIGRESPILWCENYESIEWYQSASFCVKVLVKYFNKIWQKRTSSMAECVFRCLIAFTNVNLFTRCAVFFIASETKTKSFVCLSCWNRSM